MVTQHLYFAEIEAERENGGTSSSASDVSINITVCSLSSILARVESNLSAFPKNSLSAHLNLCLYTAFQEHDNAH